MIDDGIYSYLTSQAALTTHVATRIYPNHAPQDAARPYIIYAKFGGSPVYEMQGETGLANARYRFECVADKPLTAKTVANALRGELSGYRGLMGSDFISSCFLTNDSDDYEIDPHGRETGFPSVIADYEFHYQQSVPSFST